MILSVCLVSCEKKTEPTQSNAEDSQNPKTTDSITSESPAPIARADRDPAKVKAASDFLDQNKDWATKATSSSELEEIKLMNGAVAAAVEKPAEVVDFLLSAPQTPRKLSTLRTVYAQWMKSDSSAAKAKSDQISETKARIVARLAVVSGTPIEQDATTKTWIQSWPEDSPERKLGLQILNQRANPATVHVCGPDCGVHVNGGK